MEGTHEEWFMADLFNESHTNQFFLSEATFWQVHWSVFHLCFGVNRWSDWLIHLSVEECHTTGKQWNTFSKCNDSECIMCEWFVCICLSTHRLEKLHHHNENNKTFSLSLSQTHTKTLVIVLYYIILYYDPAASYEDIIFEWISLRLYMPRFEVWMSCTEHIQGCFRDTQRLDISTWPLPLLGPNLFSDTLMENDNL